jgi:hypothetical protein
MPSKREIIQVVLFSVLCGYSPNKKRIRVEVCLRISRTSVESFYSINTSDGNQTGTGNVTRHFRHSKLENIAERST